MQPKLYWPNEMRWHAILADIKSRTHILLCSRLNANRPQRLCAGPVQMREPRATTLSTLARVIKYCVKSNRDAVCSLQQRCKWEQVISLTMIDRGVSAPSAVLILLPFSRSRIRPEQRNQRNGQKKTETWKKEKWFETFCMYERSSDVGRARKRRGRGGGRGTRLYIFPSSIYVLHRQCRTWRMAYARW